MLITSEKPVYLLFVCLESTCMDFVDVLFFSRFTLHLSPFIFSLYYTVSTLLPLCMLLSLFFSFYGCSSICWVLGAMVWATYWLLHRTDAFLTPSSNDFSILLLVRRHYLTWGSSATCKYPHLFFIFVNMLLGTEVCNPGLWNTHDTLTPYPVFKLVRSTNLHQSMAGYAKCPAAIP